MLDKTPGKRGRSGPNKASFVAAVELDEDGHLHHVRFGAVGNVKGAMLADWARSALHPDAHLVTDGLANFAAAGAVVRAYGAIIVTPRQSSEWNHSAGSTPSSPTSRPQSTGHTITSTSKSTVTGIWPKHSTASTDASNWRLWSLAWCMLVHAPPLVPNNGFASTRGS